MEQFLQVQSCQAFLREVACFDFEALAEKRATNSCNCFNFSSASLHFYLLVILLRKFRRFFPEIIVSDVKFNFPKSRSAIWVQTLFKKWRSWDTTITVFSKSIRKSSNPGNGLNIQSIGRLIQKKDIWFTKRAFS